MAKVCTKCKRELPETNYAKDWRAPDGLHHSCKDCVNAYNKTYRAEHKEMYREYYSTYRQENRETIRNKIRVWQSNNKERVRKASHVWQKNHPEEAKRLKQTRRARKAGLVSTLTPIQWNHILDTFNSSCAYCGDMDENLHQDHFVALSSGGEYTHNNIIPACSHCNFSKGPKSFVEWYPTSNCYDKQREKKIMRFLHYTGASQQLTLFTSIGGSI